MHLLYLTFSYVYMVAVFGILSYMVISYVRKQTHTPSQWLQLSLLLSSMVIRAVDFWLYSKKAKFVCGFGNAFMSGTYYILFFSISFLIAWKFHVASRGLVEFALNN